MTEFLPRSAWTDDPYPAGATLLVDSDVEGLAIHWPGSGGSISADRAAVIGLLRGELAFHTSPVSQGGRGWSDIAYNVAVDQAGRVWDLRGITRRSAANGDVDVNRRFVAVTCLIGPADVPTPALLQAVRDVRARVRDRFPHAPKVVPHSAIRPEPTDCPGDRLRAHIAAGTFTSTGDIMATLDADDLGKLTSIVRAQAFAAVQDYMERPDKGPTRQIGDGADSVILRMIEKAATWSLTTKTLAGDTRTAVAALSSAVAGLDGVDVDEAALAQQIVAALPDSLAQHLADVLAQRLAS